MWPNPPDLLFSNENVLITILLAQDGFCLFVYSNMIQIHESNCYTDLICSSCLGQQGPATISFLNRNYQIFRKKTKKAKKQFKLVCLYTHPHKFFQIHIYEKVLVGRQ